MPRRICCSRRVCLYLCASFFFTFWATIALVAYCLLFEFALPARRQYYLETAYLKALESASWREELETALQTPPRQILRPLIQDVDQLHYWTVSLTSTFYDNVDPTHNLYGETGLYDEKLSLNPDGSGRSPQKEFWIYFGGTAASSNRDNSASPTSGDDESHVFKHKYKENSCLHPKYICDMYNEAFDRISQRWHGVSHSESPKSRTSEAILRFADCDISPWMCSSTIMGFYAYSPMLVHLKIGEACVYTKGLYRCPLTWRYVNLPVTQAPWTRQIRILLHDGRTTVVPAFPDAEEQLWTLMATAGAEEGLPYGEMQIRRTTPGKDECEGINNDLVGLNLWGEFNVHWAGSWNLDFMFKCYAKYYLDAFLRWWDHSQDVVNLIDCQTRLQQKAEWVEKLESFKRFKKEQEEKYPRENQRWKLYNGDDGRGKR